MQRGDDVPVFCHICGVDRTARLTSEMDYSCLVCNNTFVEELSQGVEEFMSNPALLDESSSSTQISVYGPPPPPPPPPPAPPPLPGSNEIQQIIDMLSTGIGQVTGGNNMILSDAGGRPMGIVFQQGPEGANEDPTTRLLTGLRGTGLTKPPAAAYTIYYILYTIYYILYTLYYILYTLYYILYTIYLSGPRSN